MHSKQQHISPNGRDPAPPRVEQRLLVPPSRQNGVQERRAGRGVHGSDAIFRTTVEHEPALHPRDGAVGAVDRRRCSRGLPERVERVDPGGFAVGREIDAEEWVIDGRLRYVSKSWGQKHQVSQQSKGLRSPNTFHQRSGDTSGGEIVQVVKCYEVPFCTSP